MRAHGINLSLWYSIYDLLVLSLDLSFNRQREFVREALKVECKSVMDFILYKIGNYSVYSLFW